VVDAAVGGLGGLVGFRTIEAIVGDLVRLRAPHVALGELALVRDGQSRHTLAQAVELDGSLVTLQVLGGTRGLSTGARVAFLGRAFDVACSANILGRVFRGTGEPIDGGPTLEGDPRIPIAGPPVNPVMRTLPTRMIRTRIPMIDVFNCIVEGQKIPVFSVAGEPYNELLARIGFQADADVIVFGGMGLTFDDYHFFRSSFEQRGVFHRAVMFVSLASHPVAERIMVPDLALAVAERFASAEGRRVLVLLTDMTAYADALKEIGIAQERIPSNRGYLGDLYTQLARRYERACDYRGAGSITILAVTTMPGNDITHPVPDNTGYITEGQLYLRDRMLDPFASLSRLKQHVMGKTTREDHGPVSSAMIKLYAMAQDAERKRSMAFEMSSHDQRLLRFGALFRERFMSLEVDAPLEQALDGCWSTLAECFPPAEIPLKRSLLDKYLPQTAAAAV
jgi:V/A-type H+-transporting ATPase subunit B